MQHCLNIIAAVIKHKIPKVSYPVWSICRNMAAESPTKKIKTEKDEKSEVPNGTSLIAQITEQRNKTAESIAKFKFNKQRIKVVPEVEEFPDDCQGIVYWMSRDQRVQDNWALLYGQKLALKLEVPFHVCFCLVPKFLEATIRQYAFMLKGLQEVEQECKALNISFHLLVGYAKDVLPTFMKENKIGGLVTDFSPLRTPMEWVDSVKKKITVPFCQIDAHNIVPVWVTSEKQEYGARTIRNKIHNHMPTFLTQYPPVVTHPHTAKVKAETIDWEDIQSNLEVDRTVPEVTWATPGTTGGLSNLEDFIKKRLKLFNTDRNNPNKDALSNMSPWYHFGQVSIQRVILTVKQYKSKYSESVAAYIEESVIRRELSDNYCYYNKKYDQITGAHDWARKTLNDHKKDKREYVYSRDELEKGKTHDHLWNAAQVQMTVEGKMHGFLRMYWAKKILEWTESPEQALEIAIYLNDRYNLDGRDPNGYVGCMWSICGLHDQGWAERAVFGKIRFMNYNGCKRKFDVPAFERKYKSKKI